MFPFAFKAILDNFILDPSADIGEYNNIKCTEHPKALELQVCPASSARKSTALPAAQPELPRTAVAAPQSPTGRHSASRNKRTMEAGAIGPRTTRAVTQQQAPVPPTARPSRRSEPTEAQPAPVAASREPKKRLVLLTWPLTHLGQNEVAVKAHSIRRPLQRSLSVILTQTSRTRTHYLSASTAGQ
jgi:hypothetical protein